MINVRELFPEFEQNQYISYGEVMRVFGEILLEENVGYYSGDLYFILKNGEKYAYVTTTFGSCSGCDELQALETYDDLQRYLKEIEDDILWHDSLSAFKAWFMKRDWEGLHSYHEEGFKNFYDEALKVLGVDPKLQVLR